MNRFSLTLFMVLAIAANAFRASAANPTTQPQPALSAERHLKVTGDPKTVDEVLQQFLSLSDGLSSKTLNPDYQSALVTSGMGSDDEVKITVDFQAKTVDLSLILASPHANVNAVIDAIVQNLTQLITGDSQTQKILIAQDEDRLQMIQVQINELKTRHDAEVAQLRKQTGAVDVSPASVRERMASLQTQKESATIELAAKQARSDALAQQISKFSSQIQDKIKNDPIAAELSKVVDARQKEFDLAQANSKVGGVSPGDVDQAMASLAEAKAKLLERQEAAANDAGGDIVAGWNRELMTLAVDIAELQARSEALDNRLAAYAHADDYLDNADQWLAEIADLQKQESAVQEKTVSDTAEYQRNRVSIDVIKTPSASTTQPPK